MLRSVLFALLGGAFLAAGGCATTPPPCDFTPRNQEESFLLQTLTGMVEALNRGDLGNFMGKVSPGYYQGVTALEERLRRVLGEHLQLLVTTVVEEVHDEEGRFLVVVRWKTSHTNRITGSQETRMGKDTLIFRKGTGLKLLDHSGNTVFGL
jgi:hypothetical protein